jgi:RNA polymerase sigma factor (sigma-70 family)
LLFSQFAKKWRQVLNLKEFYVMNDVPSVATSLGLLQRARDPGDQKARSEFFVKYWRSIHGICLRHLNDEHDADDVVQIIFFKFLKGNRFRLYKYEPPKRFRDWLYTVVMNDVRSYMRQKSRKKWRMVVGAGESARVLDTLVDDRMTEAMLREVEAAFAAERELRKKALEIVQRDRAQATSMEAYLLMVNEGLSGAKVAERLNMKIGTVYKACSRVSGMLEEEYEKLKNMSPSES